ncbi:MAG: carbohydrate ABC transporter permease [Thermoanaerobaculia bacterium]
MRSDSRAALLFLAPAMLIIFFFFLLPAAAAFVLSLTDFDIYALGNIRNIRLVGLANYHDLLSNERFWRALINTIYFTLVGGPLTVIVSLGAALLLNAKVARMKSLFRTIYFAPVVTTIVAVAIVWRYLYHPRFGLFNRALDLIGIGPIDWLGDTKWAMPAIIILAVWKNFGYQMIIFVAGLQSIPEELYESARIDGASAWQQFRNVTVPMLAPTFLFVGIITAISFLQFFAEPYVMTRGGPLDATLSMVQLMYEQGFRWWNMGNGAAIAFVLFLFIIGGTLAQLWVQKRRA